MKIALLSDSSIQGLAAEFRKVYGYEVYEGGYDRVYEEVLGSAFGDYDFVLIFMCVEKLYEKFCAESAREDFAENVFADLKTIWGKISARVIQFTFRNYDDGVFGSYGARVKTSFVYQLHKLNFLLYESAPVYLLDINFLDAAPSPVYYYAFSFALDVAAVPRVARRAERIIAAASGKIVKAVVLDLDGTLWGGVVADDGVEGILLSDAGVGRAFKSFQRRLLELKRRGIILCVCSKNDEANAMAPFLTHPDSVLKLEDFAVFIANWNDKASNILEIQSVLNIGLDSFVFIDDNKFERDLVKNFLPEVIVPEMPPDPALYVSFIESLNLFETASFSETDAARANQYRDEAKRKTLSRGFENFDDYLKSLGMKSVARAFEPFYYPRVAQLSQRSNQFNLRTVRRDEADIKKIAESDDYLTLYFTLSDSISSLGLISAVIMEKRGEELFIADWIMSCRALKRGAEQFIVNKIVKTARERGFKRVLGEYIPTPKNNLVRNIYEELGFSRAGENLYYAGAENFIENKTYVEEEL